MLYKDQTETIVEIATHIDEEEWGDTLPLLLELAEQSFIAGYDMAMKLNRLPLEDNRSIVDMLKDMKKGPAS
jgi:hypothetical protein